MKVEIKVEIEFKMECCNWCGKDRLCLKSTVYEDADICQDCARLIADAGSRELGISQKK